MSRARASLATRIAWTAALVVPVSGSLVVLVSWIIAGTMAAEAEDARLRDAGSVFARELEEEGADPAAIAADEADELLHTGIRVAVLEDGRLLAGDAVLGDVSAGRCRDEGELRVCGIDAGARVAVVGRARALGRVGGEPILPAGLLAVLATSLLGGAIAYGLGRRLAAPVTRLHDAVRRISAEDPASAALGPDEGVAEIDALRGALLGAFRELGDSLARERRFARDAAHELRTPLTLLLGELELVAEQLEGTDREAVLRARGVAARLAALVERLLLLARPGAAVAREPLDLAEVIEDVRDALPAAQRARVRLAVELTVLVGDRVLLTALVGNAIENALKFSADEVRVGLEREASWVVLSIEDEGPGIAPADRERVFAPFYRTSEARAAAAGGHGVGLALIAHAAALHGGDARFVDAPRGARLEVRLSPGAARSDAAVSSS